jgi:hypothetical protein
MMIRPSILLATILAAAVSACSHLPQGGAATPSRPQAVTSSVAAAPALAGGTKGETPAGQPGTAREHVALALDLLGSGREAEARAELRIALAAAPKDSTALSLQRQLDNDPVVLLGAANTAYVVQPGDSMSALAGRVLGDPLMFYALSRYNGLSAPNALRAGSTIKIPARPAPSPEGAGVSAKGADPAAPNKQPGKANALRLDALQRLNTGDVDRAVTLLEEARSLDGADPAIERDLKRARAVQAALQR